MSQQAKPTTAIRFHPAVLAFAIAAVVAATSTRTNAHEPAKGDVPPASAAQMDHSNMNGMSMTGDVDYDFAAMMRTHHMKAVDMSEAELKNGKNPQMLQMAKDIITAQKKEIATFDRWMQEHKKEVPQSK